MSPKKTEIQNKQKHEKREKKEKKEELEELHEKDNFEENLETIDEEIEEKIEKKPKKRNNTFDFNEWKPRTSLGRSVKEGTIKNIDDILSKGYKILEPEIVDLLLPNLDSELLLVGQAKGKFGGGKRRISRQTQKKTAEGNKPKFMTSAVVGDCDGHVGIGFGKSKDTVPARDKAIKHAKINIIKIKRGCGSWECACGEHHSIPFKVEGKSGKVRVVILPAPKGKGIVAEKEVKKILEKAGIKDAWVNASKQSSGRANLIWATYDALRKLSQIKIVDENYINSLGIVDGSLNKKIEEQN